MIAGLVLAPNRTNINKYLTRVSFKNKTECIKLFFVAAFKNGRRKKNLVVLKDEYITLTKDCTSFQVSFIF
jgi:hypothetical protein